MFGRIEPGDRPFLRVALGLRLGSMVTNEVGETNSEERDCMCHRLQSNSYPVLFGTRLKMTAKPGRLRTTVAWDQTRRVSSRDKRTEYEKGVYQGPFVSHIPRKRRLGKWLRPCNIKVSADYIEENKGREKWALK